jgi:RNA polymerase sigma factor (sigma-70 family)
MQQPPGPGVPTDVDEAIVADPGAFGPVAARMTALTIVSGQAEVERFVRATYEDHQRELYSFARAAVRDEEAAEDIVAEAFLRLTRELTAGRRPEHPRAWLYRVVSNLMVSRGRRRAVAERALSALLRRDVEGSPEEAFLHRELHDDLERTLATLPRDARVGLLLAAHGFSGREIAATLGRSESACRTLLCRARLRLRDQLEREGDR